MSKAKKVVVALGVVTMLGITSVPLSTFAANATSNVAVNVRVGSVIALSADHNSTEVSMNPNNINTTALKTKLTIATNNHNGYKLTVKDLDTDTSLKSNETTETIPARAGNLVAGTAGWNLSGGDLDKVAISTSDQVVKNNTNAAHSGIQEDVQMTYGVATSSQQAQGTYTDTIVYTATAN